MVESEKTAVREETMPTGLSSDEVRARVAEGKVNAVKEKNGKSYGRIVFDNLFTFFNLIWAIIAVLMISLGRYSDLFFLFIIIPNVLIAIVLECRAKHTVEKLSATTDPRAVVVRDGKRVEIPAREIVLGDVVRLEMGAQVLCDAVVISGLCEVNESMLTGESNAIKKTAGATVLKGSFLVSGGVYARVCAVGKDNYIQKIESAAKTYKKPVSDLFRDLNRLLRYIAIFMVPMAPALYFANYFASGKDAEAAISQTCGSLIGMIPAGIFLLITVTLTLSVIRLGQKRTLVQDMYSIEMLARADVVCLDKTGTVTDGTMCVTDVLPLCGATEEEIGSALALLEGTAESLNATARAMIEKFGCRKDAAVLDRVPFSSERKYTAATFEGIGTFALGAPHFVPCAVSDEMEATIAFHAKEGKRVLLLARGEGEEKLPMALVAVSDRIRPNAAETIKNFQDQGVTVKIISGDHAATVSAIAARVGVKNAEKYLSCESLSDEEIISHADDCAVFGRVTPEQKVLLVKRLRSMGHTVAMTGDGVNDTLALKESNCAIAMADGSEMARKISQIVLLDSDFGTLPDVVREGRRCINNVRQSATLFLMKTLFTIALSLYTVFTVSEYPFSPKGTTLLEMFVIGFASVLLALEPNNNRIEGSFIRSVILKSIPSAIGLFIPVFGVLLAFGSDAETMKVLATAALTAAGLANLYMICIPYTKWRAAVVGLMTAALLLVSLISVFIGDIFGFGLFSGMAGTAVLVILLSMLTAVACQGVAFAVKRLAKRARV